MNFVRLIGRSATEVTFAPADESPKASFILEIAEESESQFFRILCNGKAAVMLRRGSDRGPLIGRHVAVTGSLRHEVSAGGAKRYFVQATEVEFIEG